MSFDPVDYRRIRAQTEERLKPLIRLQRLRNWLLLEIGLFIAALILVFGGYHPEFWATVDEKFQDPWGNVNTYSHSVPTVLYNTLVAIAVIWFVLMIVQALVLWMSFRHELFIQREMNKALELERLHLATRLADQLALEQSEPREKPKRSAWLSDDGELIHGEPAQGIPWKRASRRGR